MMSLSSSRLALFQIVLLLAHIAAAYQSREPSPTYQPPAEPPAVDNFAPGPGPSATYGGLDCTTLLLGAAYCMSYIVEGSNLTVPDKACCPGFATLVTTNPICVCPLLDKEIGIDITRALGLPSACKVDAPDPILCDWIKGNPFLDDTPGSSPTSDELSATGEALPPTSVNNDKGAAIIGHSTSSLLVGLVTVTAIAWNMF